jgi:hypothetical protein
MSEWTNAVDNLLLLYTVAGDIKVVSFKGYHTFSFLRKFVKDHLKGDRCSNLFYFTQLLGVYFTIRFPKECSTMVHGHQTVCAS